MWKGAGHGEKNMVMVTLGTGVGGGVIMGGRPLIGANGAGGEIGHICVNYFEERCCGCGRKAVLNSMRLQQELQELPENISRLIRKIQYCELMI